MCAGIFAAKPEELSAEAAFPLLIELEKKYGSLLLGMNARKKEGRTKPRLTSLRNGAGQLTEALSKSLGKRIKYNCSAQSIQQHQGGWRVHTDTDTIDADVVILSCPAYVQARLLRGCVPDLSKHLEEIPYHNVVVAAAMMEKSKLSHPPDGFGVLVARGSELHGALGVLYSSEIFPDYAPENMVLTRSILGGSRYPEIADLDEQTIHHKVENIHRDLLGLEGRMDAVDIHVHTQSIPSYDIQHMRRQLAIRALQERHPGLYISGNHLFGIGVKDCIRNSYKIAQQVHHYIVPPTVA
jgi:oxygen-dependent protoporphyrinogen oxidase